MKMYARIENNVVAEILSTTGAIGTLFHPSLHWVEVTEIAVQIGWVQGEDGKFAPQPLLAEAPPLAPSLAELLAEINTLKAQVAQLHIG